MSLTTSRSRTVAVPASGTSNVTRTRSSVVFPAPSGPMSPNNSPRLTSNDTSSTAAVSPNRLTILLTLTEVDIDRHSDLQPPLFVGDAYLDGIHKIRTLFTRLNRCRCELGAVGDPGHGAADRLSLAAEVEGDLRLLAQAD